MMLSTGALARLFVATAIGYLVSAAFVIAKRLRYDRRLSAVQRVQSQLNDLSSADGSLDSRRASETIGKLPLETAMGLMGEPWVTQTVQELIARSVVAQTSIEYVRELASAGAARHEWRRIAALRILAVVDDGPWSCFERALTDGSETVRVAAVTLLGQTADFRAAGLLVDALRTGCHSRSRVATSLDAFLTPIGHLLLPLLDEDDPLVRFWGVTLMHRYPRTPGLARRMAALTRDPDPQVRKAAVDGLVDTGDESARAALRERLRDDVAFVRTHAARALGRVSGPSEASVLLPLLADPEWSVRDAVKDCVESMGPGVASTVVPFLTHADAFARNGAAEILQNLGVFERLLTQEADGSPDRERRRILEQLARAGGPGMAASVVGRLPLRLRRRAREVLAGVGKPHAEEVGKA